MLKAGKKPWVVGLAFLMSLSVFVFAGTPEEEYEKLFGQDAKQAISGKDKAVFAAKLLSAAKLVDEQKALQALLYEKAYELGSKDPQGYDTAIDAMTQLATAAPDKASQCRLKILNIKQLKFNQSTGEKKKEMGEELVNYLISSSYQSEQAGKYDEAIALLRRALETAAYLKLDRKSEIADKLKPLVAAQQARQEFESLKTRFKADSQNTALRKSMVIARLGEYYDPNEARTLLTADLDPKFLSGAKLALEKRDTLKDGQLQELAEWYSDLAEKATGAAQWIFFDNARTCCERYLELHAAKDSGRLKVSVLLERSEKGLAKAGPPPANAAAAVAQTPKQLTPVIGTGTYFLIPIKGGIGMEVHANRVKAQLEQAVQLKPVVVVFEMDTPGGSIQDAEEIVDQMIRHKNLRYVALVHRALSAGATITFACKEIYVTESATLGAAVSYRVSETGMPSALSEKFQSVWRAVCRKAADFGQHPSILAEAMVDPDFNVTMRKDEDKILLERNGMGEVIKPMGRILCFTAKECVSSTLAAGICQDVKSLGDIFKLGEWVCVNEKALNKTVPEPKKLAGELSPADLREPLMKKFSELKLNDPSLTDMQREEARKTWANWIKSSGYEGRTVHGKAMMANVMSESEATEILDAAKEQFKEISSLLADLDSGRQRIRLTRSQIEELRVTRKRLADDIRDLEESPYLVSFSAGGDSSVRITASILKSSKNLLMTTSRGTEVDLSGRIREISIRRDRESGEYALVMYLVRSTINELPGASSSK